MKVQCQCLQHAIQETLLFLCASPLSSLLLSALSWLPANPLTQPSSWPERTGRQHFSIPFSTSFNNFTELSCINFIFSLSFLISKPLESLDSPHQDHLCTFLPTFSEVFWFFLRCWDQDCISYLILHRNEQYICATICLFFILLTVVLTLHHLLSKQRCNIFIELFTPQLLVLSGKSQLWAYCCT